MLELEVDGVVETLASGKMDFAASSVLWLNQR